MPMRRHPFGSRQGSAFLKQKHFEDPTAYLVVLIHHIFFNRVHGHVPGVAQHNPLRHRGRASHGR